MCNNFGIEENNLSNYRSREKTVSYFKYEWIMMNKITKKIQKKNNWSFNDWFKKYRSRHLRALKSSQIKNEQSIKYKTQLE